MSFASGISDAISSAFKGDLGLISDAYDRYIVSPLNAFGLGGFVFDVEGDTEVRIESKITDNYVEDNTVRQDNIAVQPIKIKLKRYVGELIYQEDENTFLNIVNKVTQTLTIVDGLLPNINDMTKQIKNIITSDNLPTITELADVGSNLWGLVKNLNPANTKQAKAYLYLKAIQTRQILCGVQTPYEFLPDMAIESLVAVQGERSKFISDFEITLKQIRKASTLYRKDEKTLQGRNKDQQTPAVNAGEVKGENSSFANDIFFGVSTGGGST